MNLQDSMSLENAQCQVCESQRGNTALNCCKHIFCRQCIKNHFKKHKDCPICQSNASFILCNGNSYTIKKKRVATWKPLPTSPQIQISFKGTHEELFEGNSDKLLPNIQKLLKKVLHTSMKIWKDEEKSLPQNSSQLNVQSK